MHGMKEGLSKMFNAIVRPEPKDMTGMNEAMQVKEKAMYDYYMMVGVR